MAFAPRLPVGGLFSGPNAPAQQVPAQRPFITAMGPADQPAEPVAPVIHQTDIGAQPAQQAPALAAAIALLHPGMAPASQPHLPSRHPDAQNAAAVAFANQRIHQMIRAHLLAPRSVDGSADPTAIWRTLSASLAHNPQALRAFLAAGQSVQHNHAQGHTIGMNTPAPPESVRPQTGTPVGGDGFEQLPNYSPQKLTAAILSLLQHPGGHTVTY